MRRFDQRQADLKRANECTATLRHHATSGVCDRCGTELAGRRTRWCGSRCEAEWRAQHDWNAARNAAKRRDQHRCVRPGCPSDEPLEVNHIVPREGRGYGWGCHNHADNLETLCRPHHVEVTNQQRAERAQR